MRNDADIDRDKTALDPIKWCGYIINASYLIVLFIILSHVIWSFAARKILAHPLDVYWRDYIILPAIGLTAVVFLADRLVRAKRISLPVKEGVSLTAIIAICCYLCLTHPIAKVLFGSFILPIFISTIFSNVKLTRWMFWTSNIALLLVAALYYLDGKLDGDLVMQVFVAWFMFLCAFLLAKILIRYGNYHQLALSDYDKMQHTMEEQLKLDPFTELYNRKNFDEVLSTWMKECQNSGQSICLAMIDIDYFKHVNDYCGHEAGDRVLLYLSQILKGIQSESIHAFRLGGDEFAIIMLNSDTAEARQTCEILRTGMNDCPMRAGDEKHITFSCGIACTSEQNATPEALTKAADLALYAAKSNGRDQIVLSGGGQESIPNCGDEPLGGE